MLVRNPLPALFQVVRSAKLFRYVKDLWLLINGFLRAFRTLIWVMFLIISTVRRWLTTSSAVSLMRMRSGFLRTFGHELKLMSPRQ